MENLILIKTVEELKALQERIADKEYISYDLETTGLDREDEVIGFSICVDEEDGSYTGYYVILSYWDVPTQKIVPLETKLHAKAFLETLVGKNIICHNGTFDCRMTESNFQVSLIDSLHTDTMILAHLLNENRRVGLKELGTAIFGEDATDEQIAMRQSVYKNGGVMTKKLYELYKADADLIGYYGAKDAVLTLKVFYHLVPELYEQGLEKFFYEEESMPLLRGPTYQLNTTGLRIDPEKLQNLKGALEAECEEAKAFIHKEIEPHIKKKYPGTGKNNTFNIGASQQLSWLLFNKLENEFGTLTDSGKLVCKALDIKVPYAPGAKREFIRLCEENKGRVFVKAGYFNPKTKKKLKKDQTISDPWKYMSTGKITLGKLAPRYKWVEKLLEYAKAKKLLNTYVEGIQSRMKYNVIRPSFLQHGTTSGRYSSRDPNFQNLPRGDKRVKACVIARQGKVFVGADYSQLEPRVFASTSQDPILMGCFERGEDFYSVIGAPIFGKTECSLFKDEPGSFATKHPDLRDKSKIVGLATPYGRTAHQQAAAMGISVEESQEIIRAYFGAYPDVERMMLESHEMAKKDGVVYNLFGRPRRIPDAMDITRIYGNSSHSELPYNIRSLLNLGMNHRVQSTAASIMNRAAIAVWNECRNRAGGDDAWLDVKIITQIHDELVLEGPEALELEMKEVLKTAMEDTVTLPGVALEAKPVSAYNLADLK